MRLPQLDRRSWLLLGVFLVLTIFVGGRWNFPLAAWLAPAFALRFFRTQEKPVRGFWMLALAMYVGGFAAWQGGTILRHPAGEAIFFAITAPLGALAYVADRWVLRRWFSQEERTPFYATLVFPLAVTALEFGGGDPPFGTFGASGYSQYGWPPVMQFASVAGLWGLTFLMAWFASVINHIWESDFDWRDSARGVAIYGTVLALVVGFGAIRLWTSPEGETEIRVVGLTSDAAIPNSSDATFEAEMAAIHNEYLTRTRAAAESGAQIVVWPETGTMGTPAQVDAAFAEARALAAETGIYLVVTTDPDTTDANTELHIIDPAGEVALHHTKYGGTEIAAMLGGTRVARELHAVDTPYGTLSGIVCWDADFPGTVRKAGELEVDLLFLPANDWYEVRDIHARMAVFRSVENGVSVFRQTSNGVSLTTDAYGRVLSYVDSFDGTLQQDVRVPLNATSTAYGQVGDVFAWAVTLAFAVILVATWIKARVAKRARSEEVIGQPLAH